MWICSLKRLLSVFAALAAWSTPDVHAADDTLVRIAKTGRIVLGARDVAAPVSYLGPDGQHIGYHMDICRHLVGAIRQQYDMPQLRIVTVLTTAATRYAMLSNETIDIDCGPNPLTASSLQQALHSHATMIAELRLMTTSAQGNFAPAQVGGRSVGLVTGSGSVSSLRTLARSSTQKPKEVFARHAAEAFAMLNAGRVDAILMSEPYLLSQRALAENPLRFVMLEGSLKQEPLALLFRLQDEKLHALANEVLAAMMKSGELERLYNKWFMQIVPGLPAPLGLPASESTRDLFAHPGSEMLKM